VKLFNYPCIDPTAKFEAYHGHSAHVTKIKFTAEDDLLISTGGGDMTVFVWDTDIKGLNSVALYEAHPDDLEHEVKVDRSRIMK
jgi:WD40 repeat protein